MTEFSPAQVEPTKGGGHPGPSGSSYDAVGRAVERAIRGITRESESNPARARASIARLKQASRRPPGTAPETWEFLSELPEGLRRFPSSDPIAADAQASAAEVAAHAALGLWASHQQGRLSPAHQKDLPFGAAARRLEEPGQGDGPSAVFRRFTALVRAQSIAGVLVHARGLIGQMRDQDLGFDYGRFAQDLYHFQNPRAVHRVRLGWGRAFQRTTNDTLDAGIRHEGPAVTSNDDAPGSAKNEENE